MIMVIMMVVVMIMKMMTTQMHAQLCTLTWTSASTASLPSSSSAAPDDGVEAFPPHQALPAVSWHRSRALARPAVV